MIKKINVTAIILLIAFGAVLCADDVKPAAKFYNFAGKTYIAFPAFSSDSRFDPTGQGVKLPMLVQLEQQGKTFYGCLYFPNPGEGIQVQLDMPLDKLYINDGIASKNSGKFKMTGQYLKDAKIDGKIAISKGKITMSFDLLEKGPLLKLDLLEIEEDDEVSGIYLGLMAPLKVAPASRVNLAMGIYNKNGVLTGANVFADPQGSARFREGTGTYDEKTGKIVYGDPEQRLQANGTYANGRINFHSKSYNDPIVGVLFKFGYQITGKPKARKPTPRKLWSGETDEVTFKCSKASPGLRVRLTAAKSSAPKALPNVFIKSFTFEKNVLKVMLSISKKASGSFSLDLINPDGSKSTTKRIVIQ